MAGKGGKKSTSSKKKDEENLDDVFDGEIKSRKYGIRIDDDLEVTIIAGNELLTLKGRLLSMKDDIEIVGKDGKYQKIIMDWVVAIKVVKHNRPSPEKDKEFVKKTPKIKPKKTSVDHAYN
jgi:hypothetical protein